MRIIFNPDNGASIKDVTYEGVKYFSEKSFDPGTLFKFEDDSTGDFFLNTFGFLEQVGIDKAKKIMAEPTMKCLKCDYSTRVKASLTVHEKKHVAEAELDELGIPVVRMTNAQNLRSTIVNTNVQQNIDSEGKDFHDGYPGLEAEGLINENVKSGAIMS